MFRPGLRGVIMSSPKEKLPMPNFEKELKLYNARKAQLLSDKLEGQYVLIKSDEFVGVYPNGDSAYKAGLEKFGNVPMLIKQICSEERPDLVPALMFGLIH